MLCGRWVSPPQREGIALQARQDRTSSSWWELCVQPRHEDFAGGVESEEREVAAGSRERIDQIIVERSNRGACELLVVKSGRGSFIYPPVRGSRATTFLIARGGLSFVGHEDTRPMQLVHQVAVA